MRDAAELRSHHRNSQVKSRKDSSQFDGLREEKATVEVGTESCRLLSPIDPKRYWGRVRYGSGAWLWLGGWKGGLVPGSLTAAAFHPGCIRTMLLCSARYSLHVLHLSDGDFPSLLANEDQPPTSDPQRWMLQYGYIWWMLWWMLYWMLLLHSAKQITSLLYQEVRDIWWLVYHNAFINSF